MAKLARSMTLIVGDLRPIVTQYVKEEETENVVDLTSAVSCKFFMYPWAEDGSLGTVKINGIAGSIATPASGKLTYTWTGTNTDTAGLYLGYFVVYWGADSTIPETISAIKIHIKTINERIT